MIITSLGLFAGVTSAQTSVHIQMKDGNTQSFTIIAAGKIYFDNDYLYVDDASGLPYSFEVSDIQKMTFNHLSDIQDIETEEFTLYPNPANALIHIKGKSDTFAYRLFSMDGRLLQKGTCSNEESINISALTSGLYILNINNKSFKITKL